MRRLFLTFFSALSLLLFVVVCLLWVRSLGHFEMVTVRQGRWSEEALHRSRFASFSWYAGTFRFEAMEATYGPEYFRSVTNMSPAALRAADPPGVKWAWVGDNITRTMNGYPPGFAAGHSHYSPHSSVSAEQYVLAVRPWLPAALAAILPTVFARRWMRSRTDRRRGLCRACGYDLRATPERCPECGAVPKEIARPSSPGGAVG